MTLGYISSHQINKKITEETLSRVGRSTAWPHHAGATPAAWFPVRNRVDFKIATLVYPQPSRSVS